MSKIVTAQLTDKLIKDVDEFMKVHGIDRSTAIRKLLAQGLNQWKTERAITAYTDGAVSLMKASEAAGLSVWEFLDELKKRDITITISINTVEEPLGYDAMSEVRSILLNLTQQVRNDKSS